MKKTYSLPVLYAIVQFSILPQKAFTQVNINSVNTAFTQNFDVLPASGTGLSASGSIFADGWSFLEGGANANTTFQAGSGSGIAGDTYSFGVAGINAVTDRAFGLLQSTNLTSIIGFRFTNNTGQTIASMTVGYTGEVWRLSSSNDQLSISYQIGDVALNAASGWITVPGLDFTSPVTGTAAAVDGNQPVNRTILIPVTITGLYIPQGTTVTFRWVDGTASSSAGMGIDDFTLTLIPASAAFYRSKTSGNWNTPAVWETAADGLNWSDAAFTVPTDLAAGITIQAGHTIVVSSDLTVSKLSIQPEAKINWSGGQFTLTDSPGDDLVLQGTNSQFEIATGSNLMVTGNAGVRIGTGAFLQLSGNNNALYYHGAAFHYADGAIFAYSHNSAPVMTGAFFSTQDAGAIPVFRYNSPFSSNLGSSGATTINGKLEVSAGHTMNLNGVSGVLTIRNGITGDGAVSSSTTIVINGAIAEIGGAGNINSHLAIETGCTATLSSNKTFSGGKLLTVNGTLDFGTWQWQRLGSGLSVTLNVSAGGIVKTANTAGLVSSTGSLSAGQFTLNLAAGSTVAYTANNNQVVTISGVPAYQHLVVSGSGIKSAQGGANLVIQGSCAIQTGATLALTGSATENLYLNNNAPLLVMSGGQFDNGGESSITASAGTPSVTIQGTFITRDQQGFTGTNAAIPSITPVLTTGCIIEYGRDGDQAVQAIWTYENLVFSGSGTKSPANALALNGTVTISGTVILNGTAHSIGGPANNLVMTGSSRFRVGGTGTRPDLGGIFSLAPGTVIEFTNTNSTTASIRQGSPAFQYSHIEISGSNVTAPGSGITLQAGASFTVKNGGTFKVTSANGLAAASNAAILSTNNPMLILEAGSTIEYNGASQALTAGLAYSKLTISGNGAKTASGVFTVAQTFTRSGSASLHGTSPAYLSNATLAYTDGSSGRTYLTGLEWPSGNEPANLLINLSGGGNAMVVLDNDKQITGTLELLAGAISLNDKKLLVAGSISGNGTITGSTASSLEISGGVSSLSFTQTTDGSTNALAEFLIQAGTLTLGNKLHIYKTLGITGGSLDLAGKALVLKSTAAHTAKVAEIKGVLSGETNVTIERYIPALSTRRYRLLTAPVKGISINDAWQEGRTWNGGTAEGASGYGTLITGQQQATAAVANSKGFDFWPAIANASASVRRYESSSSNGQASWQPLLTTLDNQAFDAMQAYLVFIRGDRSISAGTAAGATTLRATGTLRQGIQTVSVPVNKTHTLVGNPYPASLDFGKLYTGNSTIILDLFWSWQANYGSSIGNYILTLPAGDGMYETIPSPFVPSGNSGSTGDAIIQSGQGFFVMPKNFNANNTAVANLVFNESHKSNGNPATPVFREQDISPAKLYVNLSTKEDGEKRLLDGVLFCFHPSFVAGKTSILKAFNNGENLSISEGGKDLIVSFAAVPHAGDSYALRFGNTAEKRYVLDIRSQNFIIPGLMAFLQDRYLGKEIPCTQQNVVLSYPFTITADVASKDPQRFYIVFRASQAPLPLVISELGAEEQPGGEVLVSWKVEDETGIQQYIVEKSADGTRFQKLSEQPARAGAGPQAYESLDGSPSAVTYYRIRMTGLSGEVKYSDVVKVQLRSGRREAVVLYPNPLGSGEALQVQLQNKPAGVYRLTLFNDQGQRVWSQSLQHSGGTATQVTDLPGSLSSGHYKLELRHTSGKTDMRNLHFVKK